MGTIEQKTILEQHLMLFEPNQYLPRYVTSTKDIFEFRYLLRDLPCSNDTINYLSTIIIDAIRNKKRFRVYDCLRVLRSIVKSKDPDYAIETDVLRQLFCIYQQFIFSPNESIQWCVSIFIKDQPLPEDCIRWLIEHYSESEHIVNRLLRYPQRNNLIVSWAERAYKAGELEGRRSELISILINGDIPPFIKEIDNTVLLWGIYYSKISDYLKKHLLMRYGFISDMDTLLKISIRLRYKEVIEHMLSQL